MAKRHSDPYRLYQRGKIWYTYITHKGVQLRCSCGTTSRREAEQLTLEKISRIEKQSTLKCGGLIEGSLSEVFAKYYEEKAYYQTRPSQALTRLLNLKSWLNVEYLSQINEPIISQMVTKIRKDFKNATVNRYLALLSVVINTARDEWHYNCNHIKISKFKLPEPAENVKYIKDTASAQKIIDKAPPHFKPLIITALNTGLRRGNLLSLKWDNIDFTNNIITLKVKSRTKDGGKNHSVPMTNELKKVLQNLPKISEYVFLSSNNRPMRFIQTTWCDIFYKWQIVKDINTLTDTDILYHKKYRCKDGTEKILTYKRVLKDANMPYINFHILRHTTGTWLAQAGVNAKVIKDILGHEDIRTTNKYMHAADSDKRAALNSVFSNDSQK